MYNLITQKIKILKILKHFLLKLNLTKFWKLFLIIIKNLEKFVKIFLKFLQGYWKAKE